MPTVPGGNPISLGRVTVATPGTPVTILQNFVNVDTQAEITANTVMGRLAARSITVQARPTNVGLGYADDVILYVGKRGMDKDTGQGVLAELGAGASVTISDPALPGNPFNLWDIMLDADTAEVAGTVSATRS